MKELDAAGMIKRNFDNPPTKDTVTVPDGGYTIIRFFATNPGEERVTLTERGRGGKGRRGGGRRRGRGRGRWWAREKGWERERKKEKG